MLTSREGMIDFLEKRGISTLAGASTYCIERMYAVRTIFDGRWRYNSSEYTLPHPFYHYAPNEWRFGHTVRYREEDQFIGLDSDVPYFALIRLSNLSATEIIERDWSDVAKWIIDLAAECTVSRNPVIEDRYISWATEYAHNRNNP